jgi:hypothetical protein
VRTSIVPGGLKSFSHFTQHSAFGCVLGYHVPAPVGPDFSSLYHRRNPSISSHTDSEAQLYPEITFVGSF